MNSQIDTLNSQIESMQLPKTSFSFWMGIVVMIAAFFILVAGYFYWFMAYITPIILKKIMPQYYGIALNWYSHSDSDFSKLFRDNHAII